MYNLTKKKEGGRVTKRTFMFGTHDWRQMKLDGRVKVRERHMVIVCVQSGRRREREKKEKDHACGSSVVRSSLHRFLKVPWSGVWLCVEWSVASAGFSVSPLRSVRAQSLDRRPPGVAGAVAGLGLRERAVQSNLNRRARPTRGHRQSLLRLDVTRGSSCMPRVTHAPIPRTILTERVPAIQHNRQKHRCHRRIGVEVEPCTTIVSSVAPPRESDDHARCSVHRLPRIFARKPAFRVSLVPVLTLLAIRWRARSLSSSSTTLVPRSPRNVD